MVSFATLILALVTGVYPVEVMVDQTVAAVEMRLDGEVVGRMTGEPWRLDVDFGGALQPHELVAIARDARGHELSRARQMINLPRPPAEVSLSLDRGPDGRYRTARAAWNAVGEAEAVETRALFDGAPLPVRSQREISLPRYDPDVQHHLVVQVRFQGDLQAEAAVSLGGHFGETAHTEITALAVELRDGRDELPAESLDEWFRKGDRSLQVAAVEHPPAGILLVRDRSAEARLAVLGHELGRRWVLVGRKRAHDGVRPDDAVYLLGPVPTLSERAGPERWLFPLSPDLANYRRYRGVIRALTEKRFSDRNPGAMRSTQAVATAGLRAAALGRPRAVVLVLGSTTADTSLYTPRNARGYLETLQVPLFVWSVDDGKPSLLARAWGGATDISEPERLRAAVDELRAALDRQRIVWIRGRHLPQQIELSADARQVIELAGQSKRFAALDSE